MVEKPVSLTIKSKIILVSLFLSLATLFTISMLSFITADSLIEERVYSQLASESSGRGAAISLLMDSIIQQVELLATNEPIRDIVVNLSAGTPTGPEMEAYQALFNSEVQEFRAVSSDSLILHDATIIGVDGTVLISSNTTEMAGALSDRIERGGSGESYLEFAQIGGNRRAIVTGPLDVARSESDGVSGAVLIATMDTAAFDEILLNRAGLGQTGEVYLVDRNKVMVSESRFIEDAEFKQVVDTYAVNECLDNGGQVSDVYTDYRNIEIVGSSYCARDEGFVLLAEIDQAEILRPVSSLRDAILGTAAVITGVVVVTALYVSKTISRPITKLRDAVNRISRGDYEYKIEVESLDEVGQLARQFDDMRANVLAANNNLNRMVRERTKELSDMTNALDATAIVAVTDKDGTITKVNKKFVEISKYSEEELIGQNHRILKSGHHSSKFFEEMWKTISRGKIFEGEIKNMAKDGTFYWVKTTIVPFLDENSQPKQY
ncbi:MAG TPA: HAMP domain-containing protein, partial [Nitrososphaera sp.]|nr:HAMP domain-containing protein [Nitrososphaera sp.]